MYSAPLRISVSRAIENDRLPSRLSSSVSLVGDLAVGGRAAEDDSASDSESSSAKQMNRVNFEQMKSARCRAGGRTHSVPLELCGPPPSCTLRCLLP